MNFINKVSKRKGNRPGLINPFLTIKPSSHTN